MSSEQTVELAITEFKKKFLTKPGEQILGYVVVDEDAEIIVASTYDPDFLFNATLPLKNWAIFFAKGSVRAVEIQTKDDFNKIVADHYDAEIIEQ